MKGPYVLQFEQMSPGEHHLTFDADRAVFERNGNEEILDAEFSIELNLYKTGNMMDMKFHYKGRASMPCDRCNDPVEVSVDGESKLVVKFGQSHHEDLDELIVLEDHEHELNLEQYFYESLSLMLPVRHVHDEKDCNQEIIKKLGEYREKPSEDDVDPRWQKLKEI